MNIGPPLTLLIIYVIAGQPIASLCARWAEGYVYEARTAIFIASMKAGVVAALGSVALHLAILHLPFETSLAQAEFRSLAAALAGSAIFPFMACISAAPTISR